MRDQNRLKEKFTLSLDGRQVASVVVGSLVVLGAVFVLGFSVGRQIGLREARPAVALADPLAALDAPSPRPDAGEPPRLSYHEALTRDRPAEPRPAPAPARPVAPAPPTAAAPAAQAPPPAPPAAAVPVPAPPAPSPGSAIFAVQVGASQDRAEADRLADRYRAHRPRVVEAVVPGKGRWYRVKLGAFETRADAERYLRDLAREAGAKGFVTSGD
jgi:cell division septation protein DedD